MTKNTLLVCLLFHSIFCLAQPPQYKAVVYDSGSVSGYYFLCAAKIGISRLILDKYGHIVYYKRGYQGLTFSAARNNALALTTLSESRLYNGAFTTTGSISCKNYPGDLHEIQFLPNGHVLLFGVDTVKMDLSKYYPDSGAAYSNMLVRCGVLQELDRQKRVVFEWHSRDHFNFDDVDTFYFRGQSPGIIDWTHFNAAELDRDGNILLSVRNFNEIVKINRKNGSIMWRLGGKRNQFRFINSPVPFYGQHDIRRISNGHITLFDGGFHTVCHGMRALEFELDEKNKTARLVWSYTYDSTIYSGGGGGNVERLKNSNTLVSFGNTSDKTHNPNFVIVDSSGAKVFDFRFKSRAVCYRVFNYSTIPLKPQPQLGLRDSSGGIYLMLQNKDDLQLWNLGDTSVLITQPGEYCLYIPYGDGGFISSIPFKIDRANSFIQNLPRKAKLEALAGYELR